LILKHASEQIYLPRVYPELLLRGIRLLAETVRLTRSGNLVAWSDFCFTS
jgi:hypothetical protein